MMLRSILCLLGGGIIFIQPVIAQASADPVLTMIANFLGMGAFGSAMWLLLRDQIKRSEDRETKMTAIFTAQIAAERLSSQDSRKLDREHDKELRQILVDRLDRLSDRLPAKEKIEKHQ